MVNTCREVPGQKHLGFGFQVLLRAVHKLVVGVGALQWIDQRPRLHHDKERECEKDRREKGEARARDKIRKVEGEEERGRRRSECIEKKKKKIEREGKRKRKRKTTSRSLQGSQGITNKLMSPELLLL